MSEKTNEYKSVLLERPLAFMLLVGGKKSNCSFILLILAKDRTGTRELFEAEGGMLTNQGKLLEGDVSSPSRWR